MLTDFSDVTTNLWSVHDVCPHICGVPQSCDQVEEIAFHKVTIYWFPGVSQQAK